MVSKATIIGRASHTNVDLERARTDLHHLVAGAMSADIRRRTGSTRSTNQQMLWHIACGYLIVSHLLRLVRLFGLTDTSTVQPELCGLIAIEGVGRV